MSYHDNRYHGAGNAGEDAKIHTFGNGQRAASFSLAVVSVFGEKKKTSWFRVKVWEKDNQAWKVDLAGTVKKGDNVVVTGRIDISDYTTASGAKGRSVEILTDQVAIIEKSPRSGQTKGEVSENTDDLDDVPF